MNLLSHCRLARDAGVPFSKICTRRIITRGRGGGGGAAACISSFTGPSTYRSVPSTGIPYPRYRRIDRNEMKNIGIRYMSASTEVSSAPAKSTTPNIVWTTHRLTYEQRVKVDQIFHKLLWLDVFEISLVNELVNQRLGIHLNDKQRKALQKYMENRGDGLSSSSGASATEEVTEEAPKQVDLKLVGFDDKAKIKVIKEVRAIAGLGLKEAKELVESLPKVIQKGLKPEDAEELKNKLESVGGKVEIA